MMKLYAANGARAPRGGELRRDARGAVFVEFLIAFLPLFFFFLSIVQLIFVEIAVLVVQHAAVRAARAAIVILHDDPMYYGGEDMGSYSGERRTEIERAAKVPLATLGQTDDAIVLLNDTYGRDEMVKVTVKYDYACFVPAGNLAVCGGDRMLIAGEAEMPNQGAGFEY